MRKAFAGKPDLIKDTAFRNSSLQGAYFILALRSFGLDTGPISGFDNAKVDAEFFSGTAVKSNFLINIGHGEIPLIISSQPKTELRRNRAHCVRRSSRNATSPGFATARPRPITPAGGVLRVRA
jgi:hypothetical protein